MVDDEPEAVELVEFNLKQAGYAVATAADGAEALKKAHVQPPDSTVSSQVQPVGGSGPFRDLLPQATILSTPPSMTGNTASSRRQSKRTSSVPPRL